MSQSTFKIKGQAGRLRTGARPAATMGAWDARHVEGARWQFTFQTFTPDPYWFEAGSTFNAIIPIGRQGEVRGPCDIVSRDPLIIEMEIPADA